MAFLTSDQIGRLAELLAAAALSRPVKGRYCRPLFRTTALGDKYPTVDFLVDVLGPDDVSLGFFFVQVKGTTVATGSRLPVDVPRDRFNLLVRLPAPTYLIGVDIFAETAYLVAAHKLRKTPVSSIAKTHSLRDDRVKIKLHREVLAFWKANKPILQRTQFKDV
jgi:hypothetical protein